MNIADIIVLAVVVLVIGLAVRSLVRKYKSGGAWGGCSDGGCGCSSDCGTQNTKDK